MRRIFACFAAFAAIAFLATAPNASAGTKVTKKECTESSLLLGGSCTVVYRCPATRDFCLARGDVRVVADKLTGVNVKGDVTIATPPQPVPERTAYAECGGPSSRVRQCSATAGLLLVDPGDAVHVACHSNRTFPGLGVVTTDLFCLGTFAAITE